MYFSCFVVSEEGGFSARVGKALSACGARGHDLRPLAVLELLRKGWSPPVSAWVIHLESREPSALALTLVHKLMEQQADHRVMVCSNSQQMVREAFVAGANVCVHLPCEDPNLADALGYLLRGDMYVDAAVLCVDGSPGPPPLMHDPHASVVQPRMQATSPDSEFPEGGLSHRGLVLLTSREQQIAILLRNGLSTKEIAHQLDISPYTVSTHVKHIYRKLDVSSRPQLRKKFAAGYKADTLESTTW